MNLGAACQEEVRDRGRGKEGGEVTLNTSHLPGVQCSSLFSPVNVAPVMTQVLLGQAITMTSSRLRRFGQGTQKHGATRGVAATSPRLGTRVTHGSVNYGIHSDVIHVLIIMATKREGRRHKQAPLQANQYVL